MYFIKDDGNQFEIRASSYEQNILINYKLVPTDSMNFISIDRGVATDRYETRLEFTQPEAYIHDLLDELQALRVANKQIVMGDFPERIFGDNIDHSTTIDCVLYDMGEEADAGKGVRSIWIKFLMTDPQYIGIPQLPDAIKCIQAGYKAYSIWNTHVVETYNRENYFVDKETDTTLFNAEYVLCDDENADLLRFWNTQRGTPFTVSDTDFGTTYMFGANGGTGNHLVIINKIEYKYISPKIRQTEIELVKVG